MKDVLQIIEGGLAIDERGVLKFINDFNFKGVKRFYQVENHLMNIVRAFHGHMKEAKYCYVASGSILLFVAKIGNIKSPSKRQKPQKFILSAEKPQILFIPAGYAHGYKALEKNTRIIFFSTSTLKESKEDDFRYPYDYWGEDIWKTENR